MKKIKNLIPVFFFLSVACLSYAENVTPVEVRQVADHHILDKGYGQDYSVRNIHKCMENEDVLFYLVELNPSGFILISADKYLPPVIAYSFRNNAEYNSLITGFFKSDIKMRLASVDKLPREVLLSRNLQWNTCLGEFHRGSRAQQWPPEGTTGTGGWLESSWTQTAPYNEMCPVDPVTSSRSYTGCPATAMAMILNFHKTTNATQFSDADDYYHSYAGRNFQIDDDHESVGFPSFPDLNSYLDTINMHWQSHQAITNNDKAALSFACGIAASQVFTSEGSGTFAVSQAYDAYQRFDCENATLYYEDATELFPVLIQNMKDTLPAHLALVDESNTSGHNVVVDGYNTDNYFHVNFGYGGTYNGWYLIPDEMPYGLTVIEGVIVNIMGDSETFADNRDKRTDISVYPNPSDADVFFDIPETLTERANTINIYDGEGRLVFEQRVNTNLIRLRTPDIGVAGNYFYTISGNQGEILGSGQIVIR